MKKLVLVITLALGIVGASAFAADYRDYRDDNRMAYSSDRRGGPLEYQINRMNRMLNHVQGRYVATEATGVYVGKWMQFRARSIASTGDIVTTNSIVTVCVAKWKAFASACAASKCDCTFAPAIFSAGINN